MLEDVNGKQLKVGDTVILRGTVIDLYPNEKFNNGLVQLDVKTVSEADNPTYPDTVVALNTRQVELV
jgi:acyl dehydratase